MKRLFVLLLFVLVANAASAQYTAVRVNALGLATGTVNAGVDVAVSEKWSVEASAYWNPISTESLRTKVLGAVVGVRRWCFEPHVGFFWGVHSALAQYRVGNRNKRYNGWTVGVGASAGYSWMLHRRWNFSLEGGLGLYSMNDTRWNPAPPPGSLSRFSSVQRLKSTSMKRVWAPAQPSGTVLVSPWRFLATMHSAVSASTSAPSGFWLA